MRKVLLSILLVATLSNCNSEDKGVDKPKVSYTVFAPRKQKQIPINSYEVIVAIGKVETRGHKDPVNSIGDRSFFNKAYGTYQMRNPAVKDVNRYYGFQGANRAKDLLGDKELQDKYARLYIKMLKVQLNTWERAIDAYNQGASNVLKGRQNPNKNYVSDVMNGLRFTER